MTQHPITDRYFQMRKERRANRVFSFLVGVVLNLAIFELWLVLSESRPAPLPESGFTITIISEGIDI